MLRVHLIVLACIGMFMTIANGATPVVNRDQIVQAWLNIQRRDPDPGPTYVQQDVYFGSNSANTIAPDTQPTTTNEIGSLNDTLTDTELVVEGSGSGYLSTTLAYNGSDLASFTLTGSLAGSFTTGTLAGYEPGFSGSEVYVRAVSVSNAGFSFTTDVPVSYSINATQYNTVGTLFSGARIYSDVNGDNSFSVVDGDISIEDFGFSADDTETHTGVLPPSPFNYRVFFGANTFDDTATDNVSMASSGQFTGTFTVVPEPAALALLGMPLLLLSRRRPSRQ